MFGGTIFVNEEGNRPLTDAMLAEAVHCGHLVSFAKQAIGIDSLVREYDLIAGGTVRCIDSYYLQAIEITPPPISAVSGEELVEREEYEKFIFSAEWEIKYQDGVYNPYVIGGLRSGYRLSGTGTWQHSDSEPLVDGGDLIGQAPFYFLDWFDEGGESALAWRWGVSFPSHFPSSGRAVLYGKGEQPTPIYEDLPGNVLGAAKIDGVIVVATSVGFYYRSSGQWDLIGGQDLIGHIASYPYNSATANSWGAVRFSASGTKAIAYTKCHMPSSSYGAKYETFRRIDVAFTKDAGGVVTISDSSTWTSATLDNGSLYDEEFTQISEYSVTTPGQATSVYVAGDAGPSLVSVDYDGEDLVELFVDWTIVSGGYDLFLPAYDDDIFHQNLSISDTLAVETRVRIDKAGTTVLNINCGTSTMAHTVSPSPNNPPTYWPETLNTSLTDGISILWWDLRSQTVLGVRASYDNQGTGDWYNATGTKNATNVRTLSQPEILVINSDGGFVEPISTESSQETGSESAWSTGLLDTYWNQATGTYQAMPFWDWLTNTSYHISHDTFVKRLETPYIAGATVGSVHTSAIACSSKNGDLLFAVRDSLSNYHDINPDAPSLVNAFGLFYRKTGEFEKLSDLYVGSEAAPDFQWAWNPYSWYVANADDLVYATRLRNNNNTS